MSIINYGGHWEVDWLSPLECICIWNSKVGTNVFLSGRVPEGGREISLSYFTCQTLKKDQWEPVRDACEPVGLSRSQLPIRNHRHSNVTGRSTPWHHLLKHDICQYYTHWPLEQARNDSWYSYNIFFDCAWCRHPDRTVRVVSAASRTRPLTGFSLVNACKPSLGNTWNHPLVYATRKNFVPFVCTDRWPVEAVSV